MACLRSQPDSQATVVVLTTVHSIFTAILTFMFNDFLVIQRSHFFCLFWEGFLKIIFVEECSQLHPFKCLFPQSEHVPSRHRPSSSLCQV